MHAFTLTIHSHFHTKNLSDEDLEYITEQYAQLTDELMKENGLDEYFTTEVYWRRGCLDICLAFIAVDPTAWAAAKEGAAWGVGIIWTFFATYDNAQSGFNNFMEQLKAKWVKFRGNKVKPSELHLCTSKPPKNTNKLDRNNNE